MVIKRIDTASMSVSVHVQYIASSFQQGERKPGMGAIGAGGA